MQFLSAAICMPKIPHPSCDIPSVQCVTAINEQWLLCLVLNSLTKRLLCKSNVLLRLWLWLCPLSPSLAGVRRSVPSAPTASSAPRPVTARTGPSATTSMEPASVTLASKASTARTGCVLRAFMASSATRDALATLPTPSGMYST